MTYVDGESYSFCLNVPLNDRQWEMVEVYTSWCFPADLSNLTERRADIGLDLEEMRCKGLAEVTQAEKDI
jgi:hypothetical protein